MEDLIAQNIAAMRNARNPEELAIAVKGRIQIQEAEAVTADRARLAKQVRELHQSIRDHYGAGPDEYVMLPASDVLALLEAKP